MDASRDGSSDGSSDEDPEPVKAKDLHQAPACTCKEQNLAAKVVMVYRLTLCLERLLYRSPLI